MRDSSRNKMRLPDKGERGKEKLVDRLVDAIRRRPHNVRSQSKVRTK